jgi:hypothetical protein
MENKKIDLDMETDEILAEYAEYLSENWAEEYDSILEELNHSEQNGEQDAKKKSHSRKKSVFSNHILKAAILIGVIVVVGCVIPVTEVSAWRIWNLEFLFEQQGDHVDVDIEGRTAFPQYHVDKVPEGYTVAEEDVSPTRYYVKYEDEEGHFILFTQMKKETIKKHDDAENVKTYDELIGDFRFHVLEAEAYTMLEATTDTVVMVINSNATFSEIEQFIYLLREY